MKSKPILTLSLVDVQAPSDAILIELPDGKNMLVDCALAGRENSLVADYLHQRGIRRLDYVFGTHTHGDHTGGMETILDQFQVLRYYHPEDGFINPYIGPIREKLANQGLAMKRPAVGEVIFENSELGLSLRVLGPLRLDYEDVNDCSIVLKLTYGEVSFLLTGDASYAAETEMMREGFDLSATVLKVAHHGGNTSTSAAFLRRVRPRYALIPSGVNYLQGNAWAPTPVVLRELQKLGVETYRLDQLGTIVCQTDGNRVWFNKPPGDYRPGCRHKKPELPVRDNKAEDFDEEILLPEAFTTTIQSDGEQTVNVSFPAPRFGLVVIETEMRMPPQVNQYADMMVYNTVGKRVIHARLQNQILRLRNYGNLHYPGSDVIHGLAPGERVALKFRINTRTACFDAYVNGELAGLAGINLMDIRDGSGIRSVEFTTFGTKPDFGPVHVSWEKHAMFDDFSDSASEWTAEGCELLSDESGTFMRMAPGGRMERTISTIGMHSIAVDLIWRTRQGVPEPLNAQWFDGQSYHPIEVFYSPLMNTLATTAHLPDGASGNGCFALRLENRSHCELDVVQVALRGLKEAGNI